MSEFAHAESNNEWAAEDRRFRVPVYLDYIGPEPIDAQTIRVGGAFPIEDFSGKVQADLSDLRFFVVDPDGGEQHPIAHTVRRPEDGTPVEIELTGTFGVRAGHGVTNTAWKYATHPRNQPALFQTGQRAYMTYVTQTTNEEGTEVHGIEILAYDGDTNDFAGPVEIAAMVPHPREEANEHRAPAILVDRDGHIHVVYGAHGAERYLQHRRTRLPHDIESGWTPAKRVTEDWTTYPNFLETAGGELLIFARRSLSPGLNLSYYRSTDRGESWSEAHHVIDSGEQGVYPATVRMCPEGRLHAAWSWFDRDAGGFAEGFQDVVYAWSDDNGKTWRRADGKEFGEIMSFPEGESEREEFLPVVTGGKWVAYDVHPDEDGRPHVVFGSYRAERPLYHARWNGTEWETRRVAEGRFSSGSIRGLPGGELRLSAITLPDWGVALFRSFDEGSTWEISRPGFGGPPRASTPHLSVPAGQGPVTTFWSRSSGRHDFNPLFVHPSGPEHARAAFFMYFGTTGAEEPIRSDREISPGDIESEEPFLLDPQWYELNFDFVEKRPE